MEPCDRIGLAALTRMAFQGANLRPLRQVLIDQVQRSTGDLGALMDLSVIDQILGDPSAGLEWQARALSKHRAFRTNRRGAGAPRLLILAQPGEMGANTPVEFLLQDSEFELITVYPEDGSTPLPDYDVAFCAAPTDALGAAQLYDDMRTLTAGAGRRVFNLPRRGMVALDRDVLPNSFGGIDGVRMPQTHRMTRAALETGDLPLPYPVLVRPVGAHAGKGLARICAADELAEYLMVQPDQMFFLSEFVDYATEGDGLFRKYRIVFVDGRAFPVHMAVADRWDVWYMNADMTASESKRAEEAAFMDGFTSDFEIRHAEAFAGLAAAIDLTYFGIDCAEDAEGNLVVFEADNALIVHDMDPVNIFPYKPKAMRRIFTAFAAMLRREVGADVTDKAFAARRMEAII